MNRISAGVRYSLNLLSMVARQQGYAKGVAVSLRFLARETAKLPKFMMLARPAHPGARAVVTSPTVYSDNLVAAIGRLKVDLKPAMIDAKAFQEHVESQRYPRYYAAGPVAQGGAREKKLLEYFLSLELLEPQASHVIIDVASEWSIFPEVVRKLTGATVYQQDLIYPPGLHGNRIGGNAAQMPVPDAFAHSLVLHNAFEHFEGTADTDFISEAWRVLKPGGKLCILPLFMSEQYSMMSDPLVDRRGLRWDEGARVVEKPWFRNRFGRYYDAAALESRVLAPARRAGFEATIYHYLNVREVVPQSRLHFALLLVKPA
jgi:SAM-dependent methyltransferase